MPAVPAAPLNMIAAARAGDAARIAELLAAGQAPETDKQAVIADPVIDITQADLAVFRLFNLHPADEKINAPLYIAALYGHENVVDVLLARQNAPHSLDVALAAAVMGGHAPLCKKLLQAGADVSFENYTALAEAVAKGNGDIITAIRTGVKDASAANTRALQACFENAKLSFLTDFLEPGADVLPALSSACATLSARKVTRNTRHDVPSEDEYYEDGLEMLLGFAEGGGDDMKKLAEALLPQALLHDAIPVLTRLLGYGADAEKILDYGVEKGHFTLVSHALEKGAEPRRYNGAVIKTAARLSDEEPHNDARALVAQAVSHTAIDRWQADTQDLQNAGEMNAGLLSTVLRHATGETGLMLAASSGAAPMALEILRTQPAALTLETLQQADNRGWSVLARFCDAGKAPLLLDETLWQGRAAEYDKVAQAVFAALPEEGRAGLQQRHQETLASLKARQDVQQLHNRARQLKDRYRLK